MTIQPWVCLCAPGRPPDPAPPHLTAGRSEADLSLAAVRGIAHDLNNLLAIVSGHAELALLELPADCAARDAFQGVSEAATQAQALTRRMMRDDLDAERIVDLNATIRTMAPLLRSALGPGLRLDLRLDSQIEPVTIDPVKLHRVLINLILNAREATGGSGTITVTTAAARRLSGEGEGDGTPEPAAVLQVRDTGRGISPAELARLRAGAFSTKAAGRGLGLTVVRQVAQECGGTLAVRSAPGVGTEFVLVLPTGAPRLAGLLADGAAGADLLSRCVGVG